MCNHELKRLFYTKDADYDIQTCRVDSENGKDKYTLCYCEKCGQVFVMEIAKTYTELDKEPTVNEAWEFVKVLYGLSDEELYEIFPNGCPYEMTYQEAKVKYEVWKKSKDVIHVGDEVRDKDLGDVGVVTYVNNSCCCVLWANGVVSEEARKSELSSTGRHFNITHEMLKKMKEHRENEIQRTKGSNQSLTREKMTQEQMISKQAEETSQDDGLNQLMEECGELIQVAAKCRRYLHKDRTLKKYDRSRLLAMLAEEMADVELCSKKVRKQVGIDEMEISKIITEKLERTERLWRN